MRLGDCVSILPFDILSGRQIQNALRQFHAVSVMLFYIGVVFAVFDKIKVQNVVKEKCRE